MPDLQADIRDVRETLKGSLKKLCRVFGTPHWSKIHDELALFLKRAGKRIHIELPRGHLKSWIVTKAWSIQRVLNDFDLRVLIANATEENAVKFMRSIEKWIGRGSFLEKYFGTFESEIWNQNECVIRQRKKILDAPTFMATGLQKTLTSQHYDLIVADDLVEPDNVRTKEQREKVHDFYLSLFDLLEPDGRMVVIGTRYHQDDLYARILEENRTNRSWDCFIRSCYRPDGSILFPEKFTPAQLEDIKSKSYYHFATQYLNDPIDPENADFKTEQIRTWAPGSPPPKSLYLTVDPAISLGRDADYSALVVAGMFSNRVIRVVEAVRRRMIPSDLVAEIFRLVTRWNLHRAGVETFAFQKTLKYDIQRVQRERGIFFGVDELGKRHAGKGENILSKEARIRRLQPYFEQGLVELPPVSEDLKDELLSFPRGKHDDLLDALSYQLDYLVPSASSGKDPAKSPLDIFIEGGKLAQPYSWWMKQIPEKELSIYDRFIRDGTR